MIILKLLKHTKKLRNLGVLTKEGQIKLMSIKATLLKHLKEEGGEFFTLFSGKERRNKKLKEALEVFAKDLESASGFVFGFFDRCDKGAPGANLSRNSETLFTIIRDRIRNEENFLYGKYKELNKL